MTLGRATGRLEKQKMTATEPRNELRPCASIALWLAILNSAGCSSPAAVERVVDSDPPEARGTVEVKPAADGAVADDRNPVSEARALPAILQELGISLVRIESGRFQMGNPDQSRFGQFSQGEGPQHPVVISNDLLVARHEVTVGQFRRFVSQTGYVTEAEQSGKGCNGLDVASGSVVRKSDCVWLSPGFRQTDDHPVVCVSWNDALAFCQWLTSKTGLTCRLPTEAEWEYCCRAGSARVFAGGDDADSLRRIANCGDLSLKALCRSLTSTADWDDTYPFTAPVGSFQATTFGIYDMHGNVGEWCLDWFDPDYFATSPEMDPQGPEQAETWRVVRGGSWYNNPFSCRSSGRHDGVPTEASTTNGFRVVIANSDND